MTKEDVYDESIHPLMAKIIDLCKEHKIAMVASFAIGTEQTPELHCTSTVLAAECAPSPELLRMAGVIYPPSKPILFVNERDEGGRVVRSTVILG